MTINTADNMNKYQHGFINLDRRMVCFTKGAFSTKPSEKVLSKNTFGLLDWMNLSKASFNQS